ncbi:MAG: hypothetical protein IPO85_07335 [Saprospiraceae bacterium]|uniref:Prenyltransferase n=1 Tax=Candidatus Defluviibacterium haderslevense TaxID=2981993 RepID=A0A9D7XE25_9BACT|nr:hypothetical protein [Candidatus Defluviibacterium haderslevense]
MTEESIISWLLEGDVSIQYQTYRDLLDLNKPKLRNIIETEGWGLKFLSHRQQNGYWGKDFYQPKWISTHYTLLDLKNLQISPQQKDIRRTLNFIFKNEKGPDGGILPIGLTQRCDVCVNGMVLNYACYFQVPELEIKSIIDFLLTEKMHDGGFNCRSNSTGAIHSSLHTTISVLEGIQEYLSNGYQYRVKELIKARNDSQEFILMHKLFRSDKTGEIINPNFLKLYYPCRWYYDVLRALDYFQSAQVPFDPRMNDALELIVKKKTKDGLWKLASKHPGQTHFEMEKAGQPSRWNTLRALRVLKAYGSDYHVAKA